MAQRQQALINCLNKLVRQYLLHHEESHEDECKVRLRSAIHRVEQASVSEIDNKVLQRLANDRIGLLQPRHKPYVPVAGWPVLQLDELVLNTMASQLDPKVWKAFRSQFVKEEIIKAHERKSYKDILSDFTAVHEYPDCGFQKIKTQLTESEARVVCVNAGFNFEQHFKQTLEERLKRETKDDEGSGVKRFSADPDFVLAMERVRKDMILFLNTLKDLLEKMMLVKVRHLKSHTPINLDLLGTEKDRRRQAPASGTASPGSNAPSRSPYLYNLPPSRHSFRDQILEEQPPNWPMKRAMVGASGVGYIHHSLRPHSTVPPFTSNRHAYTDQDRGPATSMSVRTNASETQSMASEDASSVKTSQRVCSITDREMVSKFRKIWPPPWMSLASMEQGCYIVDPNCPTKEYNTCLNPSPIKRRKSLSDILETRRDWARMRKRVSKALDENLWREDREKADFFRVEYATLSHLPLSKPFPNHQRKTDELLSAARKERQGHVIFDCELSEWYKYLVERVHEEVGKSDTEINALLESVKVHFNMSATFPKLGKAKLALITMSLPAYIVCRVQVQRALTFILTQVLQAPSPLLTGWLAARGLPLVLLKSHNI